jgi:carboxyl-terminal processing protease
MKRSFHVWVFLVLLAVNLAVGWTVYRAFAQSGSETESESEQLALEELIQDAIVTIKRNYVTPVETKTLVYGAIKGMVHELDPHSNFLEPRVYEEMRVATEGKFGGLGIEITKRDDGFITIISPIYGTPAFRKGLLPGDRIVKIEGEELRDPDINEVVDRLRGEPGSSVTITIFRVGEPLFDVTLTREVINVPSVVEPHLIEDGIGYVKLTQFQEHSAADLDKALRDLEKQGMTALILDLRENPGGLFRSAVEICDLFIDANPEPRLLVSTRGRDPQQRWDFMSKNEGTHPRYPMVVLINGASASASEIVAGAMKDLGRAILIGTKSYGKGSVQTVIPLESQKDTALSLTTAHYFTPSGKLIHGIGIEPDIEVKVTVQEELQRREQKLLQMEENIKNGPKGNGETSTESTDKSEETAPPSGDEELLKSLMPQKEGAEAAPKYSDRQLQRAIDVLKAIKVIREGEFDILTREAN